MKYYTTLPVVLILYACQTAPVVLQIDSKLNGVWELKEYSCESGKLTDKGKEINKAIQSGHTSLKTKIHGESAILDFYSFGCRYETRQRWVQNRSSILVSDLSSKITEDTTESNPGCTPYALGQNRQHDYEVTNNELKIKLERGFDLVIGGDKEISICTQGREVMLDRRVE